LQPLKLGGQVRNLVSTVGSFVCMGVLVRLQLINLLCDCLLNLFLAITERVFLVREENLGEL
jgi:hypothetical protein